MITTETTIECKEMFILFNFCFTIVLSVGRRLKGTCKAHVAVACSNNADTRFFLNLVIILVMNCYLVVVHSTSKPYIYIGLAIAVYIVRKEASFMWE